MQSITVLVSLLTINAGLLHAQCGRSDLAHPMPTASQDSARATLLRFGESLGTSRREIRRWFGGPTSDSVETHPNRQGLGPDSFFVYRYPARAFGFMRPAGSERDILA